MNANSCITDVLGPGAALYNAVFGHEEEEWFRAEDVFSELDSRGIDEFGIMRIDRMLKNWSANGMLDRKYDQYRIHVDDRERALRSLIGLAMSMKR